MLSDGSPHSSRVHYARGILCDFLFPAHATTSVFVASGALGRDHRRAGSIRPAAGHSGPHPIPRAYSTASSSSQRGLTEAVPDAQFSVMPPPKRGGSELNNGTPAKFPKTTENPEEFSSAVKKRLQSSNRTGQACDRCKVRKIRCDGLPGGCSPCLQNSTECATTDRITGRAMSRGYVEGLEQQNAEYQQRIQELEQRLMQNGVESKSSNGYQGTPTQKYDYANLQSTQNGQIWNPSHSSFTPSDASTALTSQQEETKALPAFRAGCAGDNYLGVSGNSHLSSIKGTALSILGMEIDIADFESPDMDEPDPSVSHPRLYNKSYQAFLQSALNVNPRLENVELPPKQEGLTYASWYFRVISAYMPILHRPTFLKVLNRIYDDPSFRPTTAETVMVHMIFAIMYFQQGTRNWEDNEQRTRFNTLSNMHYHYCLSMFSPLMSNHTFQDVQALTLICAHLRNFPKPGASWLMTQTTMSLAIEMGLHRSVKRWASESIPNPLEVEMRKRTFWSLLAIDVTLSGKLGRPMRFTHDDFDVEFPDPVDDELLSEAGLDTSRGPGKCLHKIGLAAYRMLPLFMELYSTIYAVRRRPETYISQVNRLESLLRDWKESLPTELVKGQAGPGEQEGRVFALYTQVWALEFRLLLRHPAVSLTSDTTFNGASMRICVESARQMLAVVRQLQKFKSLDTTWYNSTVYVMAITTTLFDQWDRRGEISGADLAALKDEMDMWLGVMGDVGALLGSGARLREAVKVVTDGTLSLLSRSLPPKKASYLTKANLSQEDIKPEPDIDTALQSTSNAGNEFSNNYSYTNNDPQSHGSGTTSTYLTPDNHLPQGHQSSPYPTSTQYPSYTESSATTLNTYINYQTPSTDSVDAPLQLDSYSSQTSQVPYPYTTPSRPQSSPMNSGSQAWQQWTSTVAGNIEHQGYSNSMMMQMTGRPGSVPQNQVNASMVDLGSTQAAVGIDVHSTNMGVGQLNSQVAGGMSWPLNIFDVRATQQGP